MIAKTFEVSSLDNDDYLQAMDDEFERFARSTAVNRRLSYPRAF
jgi:hypothetical protein